MKALLPVAAGFFLVALEPRLWPGAFLYLAAWVGLPRWRTELAWGAPLFTLYLFWGLGLEPAAAGDLVERTRLALRLALGLLAWAWAASLAARAGRSAPLPLFLWALALRPGGTVLALGVLAWVYWNYRLERWRYAERAAVFRVDGRALAVVALTALVLAGLVAVSVRPPSLLDRTVAAPAPAAPPASGGEFSGGASPAARAAPERRPVAPLPVWAEALGYYGTVLAAVASLVLLGILLRVLWLVLRSPGERSRLSRRAVVLAVLVVFAALFWAVGYGLLFRGEGVGGTPPVPVLPGAPEPAAGGGSAPGAPPGPALVWPGRVLGGAWALGVLMLVLLTLGLGYLLLRMMRTGGADDVSRPVGRAPARAPSARHAGRVRAAYRAFLRRMRPLLPKRGSETPQEYARRITAHRPDLARAVWALTRLYEPVRYGGLADEAEAAQAEVWLARIETELEKGEVRP